MNLTNACVDGQLTDFNTILIIRSPTVRYVPKEVRHGWSEEIEIRETINDYADDPETEKNKLENILCYFKIYSKFQQERGRETQTLMTRQI